MRKHFLTIAEQSPTEIEFLLNAAQKFASRSEDAKAAEILKGKTIVSFFFESSTRTRNSFELAARRLGASILNFSASGSSVSKGETLIDTAKTIRAMKADCMVVRHSSAGSPFFLSRSVDVSVVNAGDGFHEHPTQALLDAFTIRERLGSIKGKKVLIIGDIAHSRVARSNIHLLNKMGASVTVCGPPTLLPPKSEAMGVRIVYRPEEAISESDVVMTLRIQTERQNKVQLPSIGEYTRIWGVSRERKEMMKPGAIILHPGPVNRGVELDPEVADSPSSVILDQVANGVFVRMAVLAAVCDRAKLESWLK